MPLAHGVLDLIAYNFGSIPITILIYNVLLVNSTV